jgi:hypothetical protein
MASTAAIQIYGVSATYDHSSSNRALMEWKRRVLSGLPFYLQSDLSAVVTAVKSWVPLDMFSD